MLPRLELDVCPVIQGIEPAFQGEIRQIRVQAGAIQASMAGTIVNDMSILDTMHGSLDLSRMHSTHV